MKLPFWLINIFVLFISFYFLPIQVFAATIAYEITKGVVAYQISTRGEVFYEKNLVVEYKSGKIIFSSNPDGTGDTFADDAIVMTITKRGGETKKFEYHYEKNCRALDAAPPKDLTSYFSGEGTYDINVKLKDVCYYYVAANPMYLVNINAPEPTSTAPEPFLDLPWNYDCKQAIDEKLNKECEKIKPIEDFDFSAIQINSHFDHKYPFLCCRLLFNLDEFAIINYKKEDTTRGYSMHDGYDYGSPAYVEDGDPVLAAASGKASFIHKDHSGGGGYVIKIDHGNGYQTIYEHIKLDEYIIVNNESDNIMVQNRQRIGSVGYDGNCWVEDRYRNKIHNTPDCAHIHFGVIQDKEFVDGQSEPADFSDNLPDGLTDPYGWQPDKKESEKEEDPWETIKFIYKGKERTGNKSYYLWTKKFPGIVDTVTATGGTYTMGDFKAVVKPDTFFSPVTLYMNYAPSVIATESVRSVGPVIDIKVKNILGDFVTLLTKPVDLIWYPFKNSDLSRFKIGSFYLYSSKDGNTWTKEVEVNPYNPGEITAAVSHLTYFAIMGERKDITAPITTPELAGLKGQEYLYRSEVELKFIATDSADIDPAGVKYTYYKINDDEWALYEDKPIFLSEEKKYVVSFYSSDNDGNIGDLNSIEFDIDKTAPVVTATPDRKPDVNGWYNKQVNIDFKSDDDDDICELVSYEGPDMENAVTTGTCTDKAGNIGQAEYILNYDSSKPNLNVNVLSNGKPYTSGMWTNGNVSIEFLCSDETSGVAKYSDPILLSNEGKDQYVTGTCSDKAGNEATVEFKNINIDKTAPIVSIKATPDEIWPPNGKMVDVKITGNSVDENLKVTTFQVIDEYGEMEPEISDFNQVIKLEAKRNGNDKDGRVYTIKAIAEDLASNTTEASESVVVPHDKSK